MSATMAPAFWDDYEARVAELFPPLGPADGVPDSELDAAELRLGIRLPRLLRDYYRKTGRRDDVNASFNRLVAPEALNVFGDMLVFFEEDQNVIVWGISVAEIGLDDPPVSRSENQDELIWETDHPALSSFLVTTLYWQAVHGGLPFVGVAEIDETELPAIRSHWKKVEFRGAFWDQVLVFHLPGQLVCVTGHAPDLELHAGAKTREDFQAIRERLKIDWDSSTLEEEIL